MAGVPAIFDAMRPSDLPRLSGGAPLLSETVPLDRPEGEVAHVLDALVAEHPGLSFGSYPFLRSGRPGTNIVIRGTDAGEVAAAAEALRARVAQL